MYELELYSIRAVGFSFVCITKVDVVEFLDCPYKNSTVQHLHCTHGNWRQTETCLRI